MNNLLRAACLELCSMVTENIRDEITSESEKKQWVIGWMSKKSSGLSQNLIPELRTEDPKGFKKLLRMSPESFDEILEAVGPGITKQDTVMRAAIPASTKLEMVLRYLALGTPISQLEFDFRVSKSSMSTFLPEVLQEIIDKLGPEYLKVGVFYFGYLCKLYNSFLKPKCMD